MLAAELKAKIGEARKHEVAQAASKARELIEQFGLTPDDVFVDKRAAVGTAEPWRPSTAIPLPVPLGLGAASRQSGLRTKTAQHLRSKHCV